MDTTRGGVVNALYQAAAAYAFPEIDQAPADYLVSVGALCGDGTGLHLDRPCTVLEAVTMANALILSLYDQQNAGSLGLLWQATNGENTLYLLGSIHTDRNNVYPFHRQLRDIILTADQVTFELDFTTRSRSRSSPPCRCTPTAPPWPTTSPPSFTRWWWTPPLRWAWTRPRSPSTRLGPGQFLPVPGHAG